MFKKKPPVEVTHDFDGTVLTLTRSDGFVRYFDLAAATSILSLGDRSYVYLDGREIPVDISISVLKSYWTVARFNSPIHRQF